MTPLQQAIQFFHDQLGHRLIASSPPERYAIAREGECDLCGRHGPGYFDSRPNHNIFRCTPCWSFYWPVPDVLPRTGVEKDFSFAGKIKNAWVLDATGTLYSPVGEQTNKGAAFLEAAARYGIDLRPKPLPPQRWLMHQVLHGQMRFPLLWASFGQNKIKSIAAMRLAESPSIIPCAVDGETIWYDGEGITHALRIIEAIPQEQMQALAQTRWLFRGLPGNDLERLRVRRTLRQIGLSNDVMNLSESSRQIVRALLVRDISGSQTKTRPRKAA